eukprot:5251543-Amphidinium_carterae.1
MHCPPKHKDANERRRSFHACQYILAGSKDSVRLHHNQEAESLYALFADKRKEQDCLSLACSVGNGRSGVHGFLPTPSHSTTCIATH